MATLLYSHINKHKQNDPLLLLSEELIYVTVGGKKDQVLPHSQTNLKLRLKLFCSYIYSQFCVNTLQACLQRPATVSCPLASSSLLVWTHHEIPAQY